MHVEREAKTISRRKQAHLECFRGSGVEAMEASTWFEHVHLVHDALPELALDEISLEVEFAGHRLAAPVFILGMTGGAKEATRINRDLAQVAESFGLGFGLGSGRAMLVDESLAETYCVRDVAPTAFVAWNLGGVQLINTPLSRIVWGMERIKADALCVHLNPAQELAQAEGDRDFRGVLSAITELVRELPWPVIVKETGAGISREVGHRLRDAGVRYLDLAGCGGTSWVGVELLRQGRKDDLGARDFWDWGVPTAAAVVELADSGVSLLASGGVRSGLDVARAVALGADLAGLAAPLLSAWFADGPQGCERVLSGILSKLRMVMLLTGSQDWAALRRCGRVLQGPLRAWCEQRTVRA